MDKVHAVILLILIAIFCVPVFLTILLKYTENIRLLFADVGRELLQDPDVSEEAKVLISEMLDDVFDWKFMAYATVAMPYVVMTGDSKSDLSSTEKLFLENDKAQQFFDLHMKSVMAVSPFFTLSFILSTLLSFVVFFIFKGVSSFRLRWRDIAKKVSPNTGHPGALTA